MEKGLNRAILVIIFVCGAVTLLPIWVDTAALLDQKRRLVDVVPHDPYVPGSCTIFAVSRGKQVFFGNNEDWNDPKTIYWVEPRREGQYGCLYLGFDHSNPQGGVNEKGLAFDFNALPGAPLKPHPELLRRPRSLANMMMQRAATVREAIEFLKRYDLGGTAAWQMLLADATGDAAVVSAGPEGELAFTRKPAGDGFLVSTNFNRANPDNRLGGYPCPRYEKATEMLRRLQEGNDLAVEALRGVVDAVHVEGPEVNTVYSNIVDLPRGVVYLYYWHQYGEVVTLDVRQEIAKAAPPTPLRSLFSQETVKRVDEERRRYGARP